MAINNHTPKKPTSATPAPEAVNTAMADNLQEGLKQAKEREAEAREQQRKNKGTGMKKFTFGDQSGIFNSTGFSLISDSMGKAVETFTKVMGEKMRNSHIDHWFIPLDSANYNFGTDIFLVCARQNNIEDAYTGVFGLVMVKSGDTLGVTDVNAPNGSHRYPVAIYPGQIFSVEGVVDEILQIAARELGAGHNLVWCGGSELYTDVIDPSKPEEAVPALINAANACTVKSFDRLHLDAGVIQDLNILEYDSKAEGLEIERKLVSGVGHDFHGNPIRADWEMKIYYRTLKGEEKKFGVGSVAKDLVSITGYTDFALVRPNTTSVESPWSNRRGNSADERIFLPVNVFTSIIPTTNQSLGNVIFALGVGIAGVYQDFWYAMEAMNPLNRPIEHPHSIAGLGYEASSVLRSETFAEFPTPANTPNMTNNDYLDILNGYFSEYTSFRLDIADGPFKWIWSDFLDAAFEENHELNSADSANQKILERTNHLFDGEFEAVYLAHGGKGRVAFTLPHRRFLMGQYHNNQTGTVRSLQDIDRAFLDNQVNGNEDNLEFTRAFIGAQNDTRLSVEQGIGIQQEVVQRLIPHAEIQGYGVAVDLDNSYVRALEECMTSFSPKLTNRNSTITSTGSYYTSHIGESMISSLSGGLLSTYQSNRSNGGNWFNNRSRY